MRKKNLVLLASFLATTQITGCSNVTDALKDRFIVEESVAVIETEPAFGSTELLETKAVIVEKEEEIDLRPSDSSGSLNDIMSNLCIMTKLGKTEEENLVLNLKESLDNYAVDDDLIVLYEEEIYPDITVEDKKDSKSNKNNDDDILEDEPKEPVEVEIVYHKIGNDKLKLVEFDEELKSFGYKLDTLSATQFFNDYDYETFLGDNLIIDVSDLNDNLGYNTSNIGAILTKLNSMVSDKTKYVNMSLVYNLGNEGDLTNNITLNVGLDFNNNKLLYIGSSIFNNDSENIKDFVYTKDNLIWTDVISDIPSDEVYFDGLYEGCVETYVTQREVVKEELNSETEEKDNKKSESEESEEVEYEDVNKVSTITLMKYVSEETQNYVDTKVITKGEMNDELLEDKVEYLGEVSVNNKPISISNIIDSKDFSVVMSNIELYKAKPYKVRVFTSMNNYEDFDVDSFEDVKSLYKKYQDLGEYTRCNFISYFTAPGGLTFTYEFNNIDAELNYVEFTIYRGTFESEEVIEELSDYIRLEDRIKDETEVEGQNNSKDDSEEIVYKFYTKVDKENFIKTVTDTDSGVKYTTDMIDISSIPFEKLVENLEKTDSGYIGNGQKYKLSINLDSSEIISYSLGRYWD